MTTPRVCCYCRYSRHRESTWSCVWRRGSHQPTRPDYGCHHWQREPGIDDDQDSPFWRGQGCTRPMCSSAI